jgi:hypothetical protein
LRTYTVEHIANLAEDSRFASLAEDTADVFTACFGASADLATRDAVAQSRRVRMETARKDFLTQMSQHEGTVRGIWGKNSEEYIRFYPAGTTEYHNATLQNIDEKLARFEAAAREFSAQLPATFLRAFLAEPGGENGAGGVIPRFRAARAAQLAALGAKTQGRLTKGTERKALESRLYKNLLLVTAELVDAPADEVKAAEKLFPVHRLYKRKRAATGETGSTEAEAETESEAEAPEASASRETEATSEAARDLSAEPAAEATAANADATATHSTPNPGPGSNGNGTLAG